MTVAVRGHRVVVSRSGCVVSQFRKSADCRVLSNWVRLASVACECKAIAGPASLRTRYSADKFRSGTPPSPGKRGQGIENRRPKGC
jgi:hypothetical protein